MLDRLLSVSDRAGERLSADWLIYNPMRMLQWQRFGALDAPAIVDTLEQCFPEASSYVDVGAGTGAFMAEAMRRGHSVTACERSRSGRLISRYQGVASVSFSLKRCPPASIAGPFDLALCLEVAEHVPATWASALVEFLASLTSLVVFSAAPPGQGGQGHVNEQLPDYWISSFCRHGLLYNHTITTRAQEAMRSNGVSAPYYIENLLVFRR